MSDFSTDLSSTVARPAGSEQSIKLATSDLDQTQEEKLKNALQQIERNDPLDYRRIAVSQLKHQVLSPLISQNDLIQLGQLQAVLQEPLFTSHRRILGPFIVAAKRLIYRFIKKWLSIAMARQFEINQRTFNLAVTVHILEHRIRVLEAQQRERS